MAGAPIGSKNAAGNKGKKFNDALRMVIAQHGAGDPVPLMAGLQKLATKLVDAGLAGEPWAIQMIADRIDGKVAQAVTVGDEDGNGATFIHRIERVIVSAGAKTEHSDS